MFKRIWLTWHVMSIVSLANLLRLPVIRLTNCCSVFRTSADSRRDVTLIVNLHEKIKSCLYATSSVNDSLTIAVATLFLLFPQSVCSSSYRRMAAFLFSTLFNQVQIYSSCVKSHKTWSQRSQRTSDLQWKSALSSSRPRRILRLKNCESLLTSEQIRLDIWL